MLHNTSDEDWEAVLAIGLSSVFWLTRATVRRWREQAKSEIEATGSPAKRRKIINLTSMAGLRGNPGQSNYSAAKMGVVGLTNTWSRELGRFGICANAVAPAAWTPVTEKLPVAQAIKSGDDLKYRFFSLGDMGQPEDVAGTWLYLASDLSNFVTGEVIRVDGGANF
jgi:3-oxoacyl-[acyl-carrier protein] reductase